MTQSSRYDTTLLLIVLVLLGFGLIMVFSTSSVVSGDSYVFLKHLVIMTVGIGGMAVAMKVDYHKYQSPWFLGPLLVLTAALLVWALLSPPINNVHRWIVVGPFRFQPSELAKLVMVLFTASFVVAKKESLNRPREFLPPFFAVLGTIVCLVFVEPDLGTATCISFTSILLLYLAGLHYKYVTMILAAGISGFSVMVQIYPYQWIRLKAFMDTDFDPQGINYQINQSLTAFGSGRLTGVGVSHGEVKLGHLPEAHTDFIFAIVGEEAGMVGAILLLVLFLLFFRQGVKVSMRAKSAVGTLMGLGIVGMIVVQALINMSVVVSILPTKGIPLPFISVGGSSMLVTLTGIGILLNISSQPGDPSEKPWYRREN